MGGLRRWQRIWLGRVRRGLLRASVVAVACQLVVPAGYMPAAVAGGSPFALCGNLPIPDVSGGADPAAGHGLHEHQTDHTSHADSSGGDEESPATHAWEACPLGVLSAQAAPISSFEIQLECFQHETPATIAQSAAPSALVLGFRCRAPPPVDAYRVLI